MEKTPAGSPPLADLQAETTPVGTQTPADSGLNPPPVKRAPAKRAVPAKKATQATPAKRTTPAKKAAPARRAPRLTESQAAAKAVPSTDRKTISPVVAVSVPPAGPSDDSHRTATPATSGSRQQHFDSLVEEMLAEPSRTPEILALSAVRIFGPRAASWAARTRAAYPTASGEALARLAVHRFTRSAELRGAVGALAGPYSPVAVTAGILVTHAELVLHLAAAFEIDPADPRRAEEMLRLASPGPALAPIVTGLLLRKLPGMRLVLTVLGVRATTEAVARRALRFYRESQLSQAAGSSA